MKTFVSLLVSGAISGAVYSVFAAGLVLSYSTSRVFNFAYGAIAFTSAYLFYQLRTGVSLGAVPAGIITILVFGPLLGVGLEKLVFRRLRGADDSALIVATVGLSIALPAAALWIVRLLVNDAHLDIPTGDNVVAPAGLGPAPPHSWNIAHWVGINSDQIVILASAVVCAFGLWVLLQRTKAGLRMRAATDGMVLAELTGIDTDRTSMAGWALGSMLAALGGVAAAPLFALASGNYTLALLVGATAAVLGRLRSIRVALIGGLALGMAQNLVTGYAKFASQITGFNTAVPFALLFLGLLTWRQTAAVRAARTVLATEIPRPPGSQVTLAPGVVVTGWILLVAGVTAFASAFWLGIFSQAFAYASIFLSITVVLGIGGMVSLAQAAFATLGGLVFGLLLSHGVPFLIALGGGLVGAMVAGLAVSLPALRVSGLALALATLALGLFGDEVLFAWDPLRNADAGWTIGHPVLGIDFGSARVLCAVLGTVVLLVASLVRNLRRSSSGRAMLAVRSSAAAASTAGVSLVKTRMLVFVISAGIAGLGGCLLAVVNGNITNANTPALDGLTWLAAVVLFGSRTIPGAVVAGLFYIVFPQLLGLFTTSTLIPQILFGLGAVALAKNPQGILADLGQNPAFLRLAGRLRRTPPPDAEAVSQGLATSVVTRSAGQVAEAPAAHEVGGFFVADELHVSYGDAEVLHGISLALRPGGALAVIGPNGSGKSTLASCLAGLVRARSGSVRLGHVDLTTLSPHGRARLGIRLVPESRGIFPGLTVAEQLGLNLDREEVDQVYDKLPQLAERRYMTSGSLSGGEQQMLALAPSLIRPPAVFIADEPTLGLAPRTAETVLELLAGLQGRGTALILIEERPQELVGLVDRFLLMRNGTIEMSGPIGEYSALDALSAYFGGSSRSGKGSATERRTDAVPL